MTTIEAVFPRTSFVTTVRNFISLTKPMIISLLLVTTVPAMVAAADGWPGTWLVVATLIGGTLSAGGANAINCWYDRDIDQLMRRTRTRPVASGAIEPNHALAFGVALGAGAFAWLALTTTLMAAAISLGALLFYVFIYTAWLKRRTPQNIVIGGAAGAFPPMVGWAAVTGDVSWASAAMFLVIFMWTPPHFWALSLRLKDDYGNAGVPMLPVTHGPAYTRTQVLLYSFGLVATTALLGVAGSLGLVYWASAAVLGAAFVYYAWELWARPEVVSPMRLYKYSLLYLALLFLAIGVDAGLQA